VTDLRLSPDLQPLLRCPHCHGLLQVTTAELRCSTVDCALAFPVIDGIPILIDESRSLFRIADVRERPATLVSASSPALQTALGRFRPRIGRNVRAEGIYDRMAHLLLEAGSDPRVLVVGGGTVGEGMRVLTEHPAIHLVETDVAFEPRTALICDAHDLPFADASFDGVIAQAVLEHVLDPARCVAEIHRVLKPGGLVYADTPFMQQVHLGPYDFTRFSHLGHRRLFRWFEEIDSGASCGPGMALAWAWQHFLLSFATHPSLRVILRGVAAITAFPLKYFDYLLVRRPGGLDAASSVYFLGRRSEEPLSDHALVQSYRGAQHATPRAHP
jgi:SAM-dependent methyltransferase